MSIKATYDYDATNTSIKCHIQSVLIQRKCCRPSSWRFYVGYVLNYHN